MSTIVAFYSFNLVRHQFKIRQGFASFGFAHRLPPCGPGTPPAPSIGNPSDVVRMLPSDVLLAIADFPEPDRISPHPEELLPYR